MNILELGPGAISTSNPDREKRPSAGVALFIVGLDSRGNTANESDPLLWTIRELKDKPGIERKAGEISVPAETRKLGEDRPSNVLGALAEFCDDSALPYVRNHLFVVEGAFNEKGIDIGGNLFDISVLIYDGNLEYPFNPLNDTEVMANRWIQRSIIQASNGVRHVLHQAIDIDVATQLSARVLQAYYTHESSVKPAFPLNFRSMGQFYGGRELFQDTPLL